MTEFNDMSRRVSGIDFSLEELEYIAHAVSHSIRADDVVSRDEFLSWLGGKMTIM